MVRRVLIIFFDAWGAVAICMLPLSVPNEMRLLGYKCWFFSLVLSFISSAVVFVCLIYGFL